MKSMFPSNVGLRCNRLLSRSATSDSSPPLFRSQTTSLRLCASTRKASFAVGAVGRTRPRVVRDNRLGTSRYPHQFQVQLQATKANTRTRTVLSVTKQIPDATANRFFRLQGRFSRRTPSRSDGANRTHSSSTGSSIEAPPLRTLRWVAFTTGLPFIGFGFMDNAILIIAGDAIDTSLGVTLGISTMCAAAIGNIASDLAGIGCAAYIEEFCATTLKLPIPKLSEAQRQLRSVRTASQGGMAIGMTIGCLLGMVPLLFIDSNRADRLREKARLERLYKDIVNEAKTLVEAESTCMYLRVDKDDEPSKKDGVEILQGYRPSVNGEYLYAMYYQENKYSPKRVSTKDTLMRMVSSGSRISTIGGSDASTGTKARSDTPLTESRGIDDDAVMGVSPPPKAPSVSLRHPTRVIPIGKGIVSRAVLTGTAWNIAGNLMDEPDFYPLSIETSKGDEIVDPERYRDCAVVPILDGKGRVIGVLRALNKEKIGSGDLPPILDADVYRGFTDQDVEILVSLASHVSVSLQKLYQDGEQDEEDFGRLRETIRILKEGKGIKRSITRRVSAAGCDGPTMTNHKNTNHTANREIARLFPD